MYYLRCSRETELYYSELAHAIWGLAIPHSEELMSGFESEGQQAAVEPARTNVPVQGYLAEISLIFGGGQSFVLCRPSTDWVRPSTLWAFILLSSGYRLKCDSHAKTHSQKSFLTKYLSTWWPSQTDTHTNLSSHCGFTFQKFHTLFHSHSQYHYLSPDPHDLTDFQQNGVNQAPPPSFSSGITGHAVDTFIFRNVVTSFTFYSSTHNGILL